MTEETSQQEQMLPVTDAAMGEVAKYLMRQCAGTLIMLVLAAIAYWLTYFFRLPPVIWEGLLVYAAIFFLKVHAFGFIRALLMTQAQLQGYQRLEWHNFMQMKSAEKLREHLEAQTRAPAEIEVPTHRPLSMSALRAKT